MKNIEKDVQKILKNEANDVLYRKLTGIIEKKEEYEKDEN